jgi:putative nucleotidyltransferase with HDIG domain
MERTLKTAEERVEEIFTLYDLHGDENYGEGVTQIMHMMQAANLAEKEGYDDEMVLAAFYHDIGHFLEEGEDMGIYGKRDHDRLGSEYLIEKGFSPTLAKLVASHVPTKRYLTYADKDYYNNLSDASKNTLKHQGGPMTESEAAEYAADPMIDSFIRIRYWDDQAKETDIPVDPADVLKIKAKTIEYLKKQGR